MIASATKSSMGDPKNTILSFSNSPIASPSVPGLCGGPPIIGDLGVGVVVVVVVRRHEILSFGFGGLKEEEEK
jgi:hypothetical protein